MRRINVANSAFAVGTVLAVWHTMWITLVGLGWARDVLNFIFYLHFLQFDFQLVPFNGVTAFSLIALTFGIGAFLGAIFALIWNSLTLAGASQWERDTERSSVSAK